MISPLGSRVEARVFRLLNVSWLMIASSYHGILVGFSDPYNQWPPKWVLLPRLNFNLLLKAQIGQDLFQLRGQVAGGCSVEADRTINPQFELTIATKFFEELSFRNDSKPPMESSRPIAM